MSDWNKELEKLRKELVTTLLFEGVSITMSITKAIDEFTNKFISPLLTKERQKMAKFLLENGHGGGNWRRLIISYSEKKGGEEND